MLLPSRVFGFESVIGIDEYQRLTAGPFHQRLPIEVAPPTEAEALARLVDVNIEGRLSWERANTIYAF
jgi:hypothetical protein